MYYDSYHFVGMHLIWWFIWGGLLCWIFATPYIIPWRKTKKDTPLNILKRRFASGYIDNEEYQEMKDTIENN